jgi:hypothetical protein
MRRGFVVSAAIERPGSRESLALKNLRHLTINLNAAHANDRTVRSAPTKRMLNTSWLSRLASIKKKRTGRSAKAKEESLTMMIWPKLSSSVKKRKSCGEGN